MIKKYIKAEAVNQPKGTKNESNSQLNSRAVGLQQAVNQPKGTKNESNSQRFSLRPLTTFGCKSTQRYKERKQFTTRYNPNNGWIAL